MKFVLAHIIILKHLDKHVLDEPITTNVECSKTLFKGCYCLFMGFV